MGKPTPASAPAALRLLSDAELDRLWLGGEAGAIGELDRRYRGRLEAVAYRILGDWGDAEDVVQRVLVALPGASFRGTSSLWTYLYRAAVNGSVNVLRAKRRRAANEEVALEHGLAQALAVQGDPESRVLEGEILAAVAKALLAVKPQHRRALALRIVWDLSNTEIAEQEGVPLATVGTWLRRGRMELRRALRPLLAGLEQGTRR